MKLTRILGRRLLLWFLIAVTWLTVPLLASSQEPDSLRLEREVNPANATLGEGDFTVTLTLTGDTAQCPVTQTSRPLDILLVVDHSESMYEPAAGLFSGTKMDALKNAAKAFVSLINFTTDQVGLVEFDGASYVSHPLTSDSASLTAAIDAIAVGNGTAIDQGVLMAVREFATGRARADSSHVAILMSDGESDSRAALRAAEEARDAGVRLITVALGSGADVGLLRDIASQPSDSYSAPTGEELTQVYTSIANTVVQPVPATDIVLEHLFNAEMVEIVPNSIQPPAAVNGNRISWAIREALNTPIQLSYRARPLSGGAFTLDQGDTVLYNRCGVTRQQFSLPEALPVTVQIPPTATPSPTRTATPSPTTTPTPMPTPTPTPPPPAIERAQGLALSLFCQPWWPYCLSLLLFLFLLWWLLRMLRELRKPAGERQPCNLLLWLLLPLFLILLSLILSRLAVNVCNGAESVYFWRIGQGQSVGQIFVTDQEGARPAREFEAVNNAGECVGCHSVSSSSQRIAAVAGTSGAGPIRVFSLDGTPVEIPQVEGSYSSWSPDGSQLAISTDERDIVIVDVERGTVLPLQGASDPNLPEEMPTWSPNGQQIAFVRGDLSKNPWTFDSPSDIYVVPATGGEAVPLEGASGTGFNYYPAYSPDGRWLAFTHHTSGNTTYAAPEAEIYLVPASGGEPLRLAVNNGPDGTPLQGASNSWPTWSRNGEWLAFNSKRDDPAYDLFVTRIDASGNSGPVQPLQNAALPGTFEHLPFWGLPPEVDPWPSILALWPCLVPFFLVLLAWWLCRRLHTQAELTALRKPLRITPGALPPVQLTPLWQVAPTLIVGVGGTGRWVLTHLKKTLRDGGAGILPEHVRFVLLDTSEREETNIFRDHEGKIAGVEFAGVSLEPHEMLLMGQSLEALIEQSNTTADSSLEDWFPSDYYHILGQQEKNLAAGTHGRRPMARAGLIEKIRQGAANLHNKDNDESPQGEAAAHLAGNDASRLWQTLIEASAQVKDGKLIRVLVVGSLAGGMGGTLFDLAYLARRAARSLLPDDGAVHLEGYFSMPSAFVAETASTIHREINAMAAVRELERFQLSEGFPFPMNYLGDRTATAGDAPDYLTGHSTWRMFDDVTLFGAPTDYERKEGYSSEPWATTFASMSDIIAFRMDRAVNTGNRGDYRAEARRGATASRAAVISAAGSFVYRFPLVDIIEIVQARWARKLFHLFLNGPIEDQDINFNSAEAGIAQSPDEYATQFITGNHEAGNSPPGMRAVAGLAAGTSVLARDVIALAENDNDRYAEYLGYAVSLILNGTSDATALARRAPRLAYGREFIAAVQSRLADAQSRVPQRTQAAPTGRGVRPWWSRLWIQLGFGHANHDEWEEAERRLQAWQAITTRTFDSLQGVHRLLVGEEGRGAQPGIPGLYGELKTRQSNAERRRAQMDSLPVRHYLWSRPQDPDRDPSDSHNQSTLADEWYGQAEARLAEYLGRFYWYIEQDGTVRLGLVTFDERRIITLSDKDRASVQKLADEIGRLAGHVTQDCWRSSLLREVFQTQFPSRLDDSAADLVTNSWMWSKPHLAPALNVNNAVDGALNAAAGIPLEIQNDVRYRDLTEVLRGLGTRESRVESALNAIQTNIIPTTDSTAITFLREYHLMPLLHLPEVARARESYVRNAGLEVDQLVEPSSRATVFAAEGRALEYERRLEAPTGLNEPYRMLHPLIVLALAHREPVELYALAFAADWVTVRNGVAYLRLPDGEDYALPLPGRVTPVADLDPRIAGLLRLTSALPEDAPLLDQLRTAFNTPDDQVQASWRGFLQAYRGVAAPNAARICRNGHEMRPTARFCHICGYPPEETQQLSQTPRFESEQQIVKDLATLAALAANRKLAPADWDNLVMRRSRTVR